MNAGRAPARPRRPRTGPPRLGRNWPAGNGKDRTMTKLSRQVRRECCRTADRGRPIIVSLEPGDVLGFRAKGTRTTYRLPVHHCYLMAAAAAAEAAKAEHGPAGRHDGR